MSRNTKYRNVLNENELINALNNEPKYEVKKVYMLTLAHSFEDILINVFFFCTGNL